MEAEYDIHEDEIDFNPKDDDDTNPWIKVLDENTGMYYYANMITEETRWDEPEDFM